MWGHPEAGVLKDWLLIGLSAALYASPVTRINLLGYSIAFMAVLYYNQAKKRAALEKVAQQLAADAASEKESELTPLVTNQR